jgi:hypothetical protein
LRFQAHIFYTKNCDGANVWIRRHLLLQHDNNIIGFDTESKVIRKKGVTDIIYSKLSPKTLGGEIKKTSKRSIQVSGMHSIIVF